jgi:hypothetical protein
MNEIKKNCYMIIEADTNDRAIQARDTRLCDQTFSTVEQAEEYIQKDALDTIQRDEEMEYKNGRDETWGSDHIIVKVMKIVRPVPVTSIAVTTMEVK